jgi:hypothetical protein
LSCREHTRSGTQIKEKGRPRPFSSIYLKVDLSYGTVRHHGSRDRTSSIIHQPATANGSLCIHACSLAGFTTYPVNAALFSEWLVSRRHVSLDRSDSADPAGPFGVAAPTKPS